MRLRTILATAVVFATVAAAVAVGGCSSGPTAAPSAMKGSAPAGAGAASSTSKTTAATGTKSGGMVRNAPTVAMHTVINGGVQTIRIDLSSGTYKPNLVFAKAGVPIVMTFGEGQKCVKTLVFPSFDIKADMTKGPRTFKLPALKSGSYKWQCGMNMQHGVLKVQ